MKLYWWNILGFCATPHMQQLRAHIAEVAALLQRAREQFH